MLLGHTSPSLALDTTLVGATDDAEEALLTPGDIPRVGADPVVDTALLTVADQLDSMTTLVATAGVLIDTRRIAHEILINLEGNLEGTVAGKLGLHVLLTRDGVRVLTVVLLAVPIKRRIASAAHLALRSDHAAVVASGVRIALISDNTAADPVLPGAIRITTVARTAALGTAVHILSRKTDVLAELGAETIAHGLDGTEGPAGTAVLLVADVLHGGARGPVGTRIEGVRGIATLGISEGLPPPAVDGHALEVDTKKATSLALGHASDGVVAGPPEGLLVVDLTDQLGADSDLLSEGDGCNDSNKDDELVHI